MFLVLVSEIVGYVCWRVCLTFRIFVIFVMKVKVWQKFPLVSNDNLRVTASLCDFRDMCRLLRVVPAMPAVALFVILCELC